MTVIFYDGFDIYNNAAQQTFDLITLPMHYGVSGIWYAWLTFVTGYDGAGRALSLASTNSTDNSIQLPVTDPMTSFSIGAHIFPTYGSPAGVDIFTIQNIDTANYIRLTTVSNNPNSLNLVVNGASNILTFVDPLDQNTWQHIELQGTITSSNQVTINLYIGGSLAATWSGAGFNTMPYEWTGFYVGKRGGSGSGTYLIDNLFLTDGDHLGIVEIKTLIPTSDTLQKDGIAISGNDNYSLVNNYSLNMTPRFIAFTEENLFDSYQVTDLSISDDDYDIVAVQGIGIMNQSVTLDAVNGYIGIKSSGIDAGAISTPLTQGIFTFVQSDIITENPATTSAWLVTGINDLQINVGRALD